MPSLNLSNIKDAKLGSTNLSAVYMGSVLVWPQVSVMPTVECPAANGFMRTTGQPAGCVAGNVRYYAHAAYNFTSASPSTAQVETQIFSFGVWQNQNGWEDAGKNVQDFTEKPGYQFQTDRLIFNQCSPGGAGKTYNLADSVRMRIRDEFGTTDWSHVRQSDLDDYEAWVIETYGSWESYYSESEIEDD